MKKVILKSTEKGFRIFRKHPVVTILLFTITLCIFSHLTIARTTYIINDGSTVLIRQSFSADPMDVLAENGISLESNDYVTTSDRNLLCSVVDVKRCHTVYVTYDNIASTHFTYSATVSDLMSELNISPNTNHRISCELDSPITNGMSITVNTVSHRIETTETHLSHDVITLENPQLASGSSRVVQYGQDGKILTFTKITSCDGLEISKVHTHTHVIEPVDEIVEYGTAPVAIPTSFAYSSATDDFIVNYPLCTEGSNNTITTITGETLTYSEALTVTATAYTTELQENKITATGTVAHVGGIAVDPTVIPLNSKLYIVASDGTWIYGYAVAEDTGGLIKGNRIDLFYDTHIECVNFGVRTATVYILA